MMTRKSIVIVMLPMLAWTACSDDGDSATTTSSSSSTSTGSTSAGTGGEAAQGGGGATAGSGGAGGSAETCGDAPVYGAQGSMNTAECTACVDEACCDERAACGDDPDCLAFRDCAVACSVLDTPCLDACKAMSAGNGVASSAALASCRQNNCGEECANLACFGNQVWPSPSVTDYTIVISVGDFSSSAPVAGVEVKICDVSDAYCAAPLATHTSDAEGKVTATFPAVAAGLGAFIEMNAAGYVPAMHYLMAAHPDKAASLDRSVAVVPTSLFDTLASFAGITVDPTRGHLIVTARDCGDVGLVNATMSADTQDAQSSLVYLVGGLPDAQATGTDRSGRVNLINVPEGPALVTTSHVTTASDYSQMAVNIRPGYLTSFAAVPTP